MTPFLLVIFATVAAIVSLEALASPSTGGSTYALPIIVALTLIHAVALGKKRECACWAGPAARKWGFAIAGVVLLLCAETLVRQTIAISANPVSIRGGAQLSTLIQTFERMLAGGPVYDAPILMAGYETFPSAMPGLTLPFLGARAASLDWRAATLASEALAAALAIAAILALTLRGAPITIVAGTALGLGGFLLAPKLEGFPAWGIVAPLWPLIAGLGIALAFRKAWPAALLAGVLASMSIGWLILFPVICAVMWRLERDRAILPIVFGAAIPAIALLTFRDEMFTMFSGMLGVPFLRADPQSAGEIEPWLFPTLSGAATAMKMGPPLFAWVLLFIGYSAKKIISEPSAERALDRFALAAFIVVACGPATFSFDYYSHVILLGGLFAARWMHASTAPDTDSRTTYILPWLASATAFVLLLAPVSYKIRKGNALALDRREGRAQPAVEMRMSGWLEPDSDGRVMSDGNFAEIAFHLRRARPCVIEVDLEVPGGEYTPYNPITVRLNGREIGEWIALPGQRFACRIEVADSAALIRGMNVISIEAAWARSMKSLGIWNDARPTAFRYGGLKYEELR